MATVAITKSAFNSGEWNPALWRQNTLAQYASGNKTVLNMVPRIEGGVDNRAGLHFVNATKFSAQVSRLWPFIFSTQQAYILEFGNLYIRVYANNGVVVNTGVPVEIVTPYAAADVALLKFEQSADVLFITHPNYPPATLSRTSPTVFVYAAISFEPGQLPPSSLVGGGGANSYVVTAVNAQQQESIPSNVVMGSGSVTLTWVAPSTGAPDHYNIYVNTNGTYVYIGKTDGNVLTFTSTATLVTNANTSLSPPQNITLFNGANLYPGVSAFYGGRLIFARTNTQPQTLFGSVTGDFENMNYSSPVQDNDAFQFTINSRQVNEIRWIISLRVCIIGTSGGEWLMQPGTNATSVTPTSVDIQPQSNWGVSDVPPIVIGYSVLFVDRSTKVIRTLSYQLAIDAYDGQDISILARHLFQTYGVNEWAYQPFPPCVIWAVRADGTVCAVTYYAEQKVVAWHRHQTAGTFESVAAIPLPTGETQIWYIVNRTVGGLTARYVEYMDNREFDDIQDAFFVDCGLTYNGTPAMTFSGLSQLEGQTVVALADGNVVKNLVVTGGTVTLPNPASVVCIGLPYTCTLETLDLNVTLPERGELSSIARKIVSASVVMENTRELFIGPESDRLVEVPFRTTENYGQPTNLFTGEKPNISIKPGSGRSSSLIIQTVSPVPLTVISVAAQIEYGDR
jgi:hypothetical protein